MRVKLIALVALLILIIAGGAFLILSGRGGSPHNIADIEEFLAVPNAQDIMEQMQAEAGTGTPEEQAETARTVLETTSTGMQETTSVATMNQIETSDQTVEQTQVSGTGEASGNILQSNLKTGPEQTAGVTSQEKTGTGGMPPGPKVGNLDIDVDKINVPDIQPELGGGISISGTIALEEAYYKQHDLQKAQKLALDILKQNPNDPTAKKILKLIEYESKGNQALKRGDYSTALQYFQKMQEIDPNNKWAKKGIIRAQSGG